MPDLPAPGESGGFLDCGSKKLWLLMPYYIAKAMVLLALGQHPIQKRELDLQSGGVPK